ncbi:MAG: dephospho-CoA kinase [Bacteroidales bacterium]|nr:dephospho-CoA kinase [Bacteroidales bacterium]
MKIGLTGGIGSGKSTVAKVFETLLVPVFNSDLQAKYLMENSSELQKSIIEHFGNNILSNNIIDKKKLAEIVFSDTSKLQTLNKLVHPYVFQKYLDWIKENSSPYTIMEAAIIYESGADTFLDMVIFVDAPEETRINRVINRDGVTKNDVVNRMKNQLPSSVLRKKADFIVDNSGKKLVIPQLLLIHNKLLNLCKK